MNKDTKVVVLPEAIESAYSDGYSRFEDSPEEMDPRDIEAFHDSATYANHVLPDLRAAAGYRDSGHGTYQKNGKVVIVEYPEDRPMNGELTEAKYVFEQLSEAWHNGAYAAIDGRDKDVKGQIDLFL